jgi:hypothetical protein
MSINESVRIFFVRLIEKIKKNGHATVHFHFTSRTTGHGFESAPDEIKKTIILLNDYFLSAENLELLYNADRRLPHDRFIIYNKRVFSISSSLRENNNGDNPDTYITVALVDDDRRADFCNV